MHPLDNPVWHALQGPFHARFRHDLDGVAVYDPEVGAFASVGAWGDESLAAVLRVAQQRGVVLFRADVDDVGDTGRALRLVAYQYVLEPDAVLPAIAADVAARIERLGPDDAAAMIELVRLTEPGPFLPRTYELGDYYGVRDGAGGLLALAGERMHLAGFCEISAVCTHPDARGQGLAAALTTGRVAEGIRARGEVPFLHVVTTNTGAMSVYERLGFTRRAEMSASVFGAPSPH